MGSGEWGMGNVELGVGNGRGRGSKCILAFNENTIQNLNSMGRTPPHKNIKIGSGETRGVSIPRGVPNSQFQRGSQFPIPISMRLPHSSSPLLL